MPSYSHSRIGSFETCPQQYKFQYIDKVEVTRPNTVEAFLGSIVHTALEKLYTDLRFDKHLSLEDVLAFFNDLWHKSWNEDIVIVKQDYTAENYRKMGERYLSDYYHHHKPFDEGKIIGLETQDSLSLDPEGNYSFHIRI